jgi:hypothetical protein
VHRLAQGMPLSEHLHSHLLQALSAQALVQMLKAHLRVESEHLREPDKCLLVMISLGTCMVGKLLQSLGALSLLSDTRRKSPVLSAHRIIETGVVGARSSHRGLIVGRRSDDPFRRPRGRIHDPIRRGSRRSKWNHVPTR